MNSCIIKGRLTRDPELKTAGSGVEFCQFTVAVNRRKMKDKEQQADFFDCTAFGNTGVAISKYMTKGREILVRGRMESTKIEKDGMKRTYWDFIVDDFEFCGSKGDGQASAPAPEVDAGSGMEKVNTAELPF
jgi:single-strand DNA-binding protein